MMIKFVTDTDTKKQAAHDILTNLPQWFGLPDSTGEYIEKSAEMPFWIYYAGQIPVGFAALKQTAKRTAEIYVMGVLENYHRKGIGRVLIDTLERYAKDNGYIFLQVKTVRKGCYSTYDTTNAFYEAMGFEELECFPTLWDEWNPCQLYVKYISK